jgi:subtilisin family serine protease
MKRVIAVASLSLLIGILVSGCTTLGTARAKPIPVRARADPGQYVVVTLRNDPRAQAEHPGSTPRGYDAAGRYGVTGNASGQARALERQYGLREVSAWPIATLHVHCIMFAVPGAISRATLITQLGQDRRVESVQPLNEFITESEPETPGANAQVGSAALPYNDPYARLQVSLRELAVPAAQHRSRGAGVQVAVIDSGVDVGHPDLKGQVIARGNFVDEDDARFRGDTHGTEVAGVIAAVTDNGIGIAGVAPDAHVIALKACWQSVVGPGAVCNSFTLAQALEAAIVAHADIVNMSLAGPTDPLLARIIASGAAQGVIFVGAAGKSGTADTFPAELDAVLAVDAAEENSGNLRHLQAPGQDVLTLVPGGHYDFASGSSLAAAEISGIVALMLADRPHLSVAEIRSVLLHSSHPVDSPAGRISMVDACAALYRPPGRITCGADPGAPATPGGR